MNEIIKDELLHMSSSLVPLPLSAEDKKLLDEMYAWVRDHKDEAVGLSAVQVGIPKRMCAIRSSHDGHIFNYKLVNPKIIMRGPKSFVHHEGCLSVLGDGVDIRRFESVTVTGYDAITNKNVLIKASGFEAAILQHELDHMDGILITDKAVK